jgi:hypothetical protein
MNWIPQLAPPEGRLYHYSSIESFLSILKSKSLWMTHIKYLNDEEEFKHALSLIKEVLQDDYPGLPISYDSVFENTFPPYTFSFTTKKDLLSQWRGYCPKGGYAFSINMEVLHAIMRRYSLALCRCLYNTEEKKEFIRTQIVGVTPKIYNLEQIKENSQYPRFGPERMTPDTSAKTRKLINRQIYNYAPLFKHESFEAEQECRLVTYNQWDGILMGPKDIDPRRRDLDTQFRAGQNTLIPYLEVPFQNQDIAYHDLIDEVVIGPTPDKPRAKAALELMLNSRKGQKKVDISHSNIPYKNW